MSERIALYAGTRNIYHDMVVSAKSLLFNNGADRVIFLTEDDDIGEDIPSCISCINVSNQQYFPAGGPNFKCRWTYMVMMRVALTKLFPDLNRILTLDHDTIVRKPIDYLWSLDLGNYYFAAVEEKQINIRSRPYYNFGMVMHNLAQLRADGADDTIIRSVNTVWFEFCEQDAVNSVCKNHILPVPPEYNNMRFNFPRIPDKDVIIQHYAARLHPLDSYPDYQHFNQMTWKQVFAHERSDAYVAT